LTTLVVTAIPGREAMTARTLELLDQVGAAEEFPGRKVLFWTGMSPPALPLGSWRLLWLPRRPTCAKNDLWWMLPHVPTGDDLILLEDDIEPCRNLVPYLEVWRTPPGAAFTTFFNGRRVCPGLQPALGPDGRGFWFSQCLKLPASFVELAAATDVSAGRYSVGQDVALGRVAADAGLGVWYHTSLVQHVGEESVGAPGSRLTGRRAPAPDFVGPDFNALTLLG
jgi:hypothetical protein